LSKAVLDGDFPAAADIDGKNVHYIAIIRDELRYILL